MDEKLLNYQSFFADQIQEEVAEQKKMNNSPMSRLFKSGELALGYVDSVQQELGLVVFKFPRGMAPRLKVQKSITVIKKGAKQEFGERITDWSCKWGDFCSNPDYHSSGSDVLPLHYLSRKSDGYDYVACSGLSISLFDLFMKTTKEGKSLTIIMYDPFKPVEYFKNLAKYIDLNPDDEDLLLEPTIKYEEWQPIELAYNKDNPDGIAETIEETLETEGICIVQGPPGSGKSRTIATITANYLREGKSVCVTTMANKGLVELIKQKPLAEFVLSGSVLKTNLSIDERTQVNGVRNANNNLAVLPGELLCATNYVLSGVFNEKRMQINGLPSFDLIVIEEASQAFLTTIAAFKKLGKKCLIVGDPMQLPPIVKLGNPLYTSWNVNTQLEGLKTFALGSRIKAFKIVTTFRLTSNTAAMTSLFYGNRFASVKEEYTDFSAIKSPLFPNEGGVLLYATGDSRNGVYSPTADSIIRKVISSLEVNYPNTELAIITPFKDTVKELQERFSTSESTLSITIDTVDRIQGMTVDYSILYLPGRNPSFALEDRRFNVATSRSSSTTLIITDITIEEMRHFHSVSSLVMHYLSQCDVVDKNEHVSHMEKASIPAIEVVPKKTNEKEPQTTPTSSTLPVLNVVGKIDLSQFERKKVELSAIKKNYYLIDTNVFVDCPDVINRIDKKYPVILSAKVADELDKMKIKLEERKKQNAEKALRLLNTETEHEIIYEFADTSLLPEDFDKRSSDNLILSVALKYKQENPILLTSDNGLQLKSKIFGISTVSLRNFLKR